MENYRKLTLAERNALSEAGCRADHWDSVEVAPGFTADGIENCRFAGRVRLGRNVRISGIGSHIANYIIGDDAVIDNVGRLETRGPASFGQGVRAAVINENGGRSVTLWNGISAQTAYILAVYRHRPQTIARMERMIAGHIRDSSGEYGEIGAGAVVRDCGALLDVRIGPGARICGAAMLSNGTVLSAPDAPAFIGAGVKMYDFIAAEGCRIDNGTLLRRCYVGQAVEMSAFTATDSVFFACSSCENGEAASIFAGPFTVSHHKSTLLIAGMFSFFNAGSGTNQSNHLFKTGAVHQGIHMRGCKFGSDAYVMLPVVDGPFTTVTGRHKSHHDTSRFPFSYLVEEKGSSWLLPAINLTGCGLERDLKKWPARDRRGVFRRDTVNYEFHNPYTAEKIMQAMDIADGLLAKGESEVYIYERAKVKDVMLKRGRRLYALALDAAIGQMLSSPAGRLESGNADYLTASGHWTDAGGMFIPSAAMERLLDDIDSADINSVAELDSRLAELSAAYPVMARLWALDVLARMLGRTPTEPDIAEAVVRGTNAEETLRKMREEDAGKDFSDIMKISYGLDSYEKTVRETDFKNVRGTGTPI